MTDWDCLYMQRRQVFYEKPSKRQFEQGLPRILIIHSSHLISFGQLSASPSFAQNSVTLENQEKERNSEYTASLMTSRSLKANVGERAYWKNLTPKTTLRSKSREIFRVNNCSLPMMKMDSRGIIQFLNNNKGHRIC